MLDHFSTRCFVKVREPSRESIKIVSLATKKVNERPVAVLLESSVIVGFPPDSTNFPSAAVYSACSAIPRRSPCLTITFPSATTRLNWPVGAWGAAEFATEFADEDAAGED